MTSTHPQAWSSRCLPSETKVLVATLLTRLVLLLLVGAFSPVSHEGLHQGRKQTSVYILVIHSTSHYTTNLFYSNHNSIIPIISQRKPRETVRRFGAHLPSASTQHGNLHQLPVMRTRDLFHSAGPHRCRCEPQFSQDKNWGEDLEKMQVNEPEEEKLARKKSLTVDEACTAVLTYSRLKRGKPLPAGFSTDGSSVSAVRSSPLRGFER